MNVRIVTNEYPIFLPESHGRSEGIHVSGIIRCIATEAGILTPDTAEELSLCDVRQITDPVAILRISIGLAIEQYYIPEILAQYGVLDHPGEMKYQGVYMTHDGEDLSVIITLREPAYKVRIHEVKATYKSTRTVADLASQWMWLAQMKAYCIARGTNVAVMHVWFMCGDYKFPIRPVREVWELEFTDAELDDNWTLLRQYKEERLVIEGRDNDGMERFGE